MKSAIVSIALLLIHTPLFAQAKNEGDKFLGTWNGGRVARNRIISDCVIRRRGSEYTLQYVKYAKGGSPLIQAFFYKLKGDSLVGEDKSYGNVIFIPETGHIKWKEGESGEINYNANKRCAPG